MLVAARISVGFFATACLMTASNSISAAPELG
jgi:hypothetical protein